MVKLLLRCVLDVVDESMIEAIRKDLSRLGIPYERLYEVLRGKTSFRNIFFYRLKKEKKGKSKCFRIMCKILEKRFPQIDSIEIYSDDGIGGGLYIPHNYCVISCKSIGENVTIRQGVTIGKGADGKRPILGDNIEVFPNAIIAGGIVIGDNTYIGANALVLENIESNCTVKGIKAEICHYMSKKKI